MKRIYNYFRCLFEDYENLLELSFTDNSNIVCHIISTDEIIVWTSDYAKGAYKNLMWFYRLCVSGRFNEMFSY